MADTTDVAQTVSSLPPEKRHKPALGSQTVPPGSPTATTHLPLPATLDIAIMSPPEVQAITVRLADISSHLQRVLDNKGVAIVTGVLSAQDIRTLEQKMKEDLAELVDSDRVGASASPSLVKTWERARERGVGAWPAAALADLGVKGRFQERGLPHGRFAWGARLLPAVRRVYAELHACAEEDLVASCDNSFVANHQAVAQTTNASWPHVDQNDNETRFKCRDWKVYQSILYVWPSDVPRASTTVVWPGSHLPETYGLYMNDPAIKIRMSGSGTHFTPIDKCTEGDARDRLLQGWRAHARRIPVPAGSLLVWSSRTTHQGWSGGPRLAQPICWEPRTRRSELARQRKLRMAALGLPSTHWASLGLPHNLSMLSQLQPVAGLGDEKLDKTTQKADTFSEEIHLPLKRAIRSQALCPSADPDALWKLLEDTRWLVCLPTSALATLEASIGEEWKAIL